MQNIQKNTKYIVILASLIFFLLVIIIITSINKKSDSKTDQNILEVHISIKDHKFIPNIVEIPKFTKLRLIIHNQDDTIEEFESTDLHREKIIMPKDSINIILAPLSPGKYDFFGDFHQEMAQGSIIVNN